MTVRARVCVCVRTYLWMCERARVCVRLCDGRRAVRCGHNPFPPPSPAGACVCVCLCQSLLE